MNMFISSSQGTVIIGAWHIFDRSLIRDIGTGFELALALEAPSQDEDDDIAYFTVRWKTRASFVYRTKNIR